MYKQRKKLLIGVCVAFTALFLSLAVILLPYGAQVVLADGAEFKDSVISDVYFKNDSLDIPEKTEVEFDGATYRADYSALLLPDGEAVNSKSTTLGKVGTYTLIYSFETNGKKYNAKKNFKVVEKNWSTELADSTVTYGKVSTNESGADSTGLIINLAAGDTFRYNEPVDLRKNSLTEIITMFSAAIKAKQDQVDSKTNPDIPVNFQAGLIEVTLTDCYDPNSYVTCVVFISRLNGEGAYSRTRASGQGEFGLYYDCPTKFNKPNVYIDGDRYGVYNGDYGQTITEISGSRYTKWSIDSSVGNVYISAPKNNSEKRFLINQLYNEEIGGTVFGGFTTGEVYVSVTSNENYTSSTYIEIEQIGGRRGEMLVSRGYEDDVAPSITVKTDGKKVFYVRRGTSFDIFDAVAYDPNLIGSVTSRVYYNYGTTSQSSVAVKHDGTRRYFVPTKVGTYNIEYSAKDSFGNIGRKTITVYSVNEPIISAKYEKLNGLTAGEKAVLPQHEVSGLNGDVSVEITVIGGNKTINIDPDMREFTPLSVGDYTIRYIFDDGLFVTEEEYTVKCIAGDKCSFATLPIFEKYYVKGLAYSLPEAEAYEFKGVEPDKVDYTAYVSYDEKAYEKIADPDNIVVTGNYSIRFKYVAKDAVYESDLLEIVDADYNNSLDMSKYFKGDFSSEKDFTHIDFKSEKDSEENSLSFINPLLTATFSLTWALPSENLGIASYSVVLTEKGNSRTKKTFTFSHRSGNSYLSFEGEEKALTDKINDGSERKLSYKAGGYFVYTSSKQSISLACDLDPSKYVYAEIILHGATKNTVLRISRIQNQLICKDTSDDFAPQIYSDVSSGSVEIGTKAVISTGKACDALSPILKKDLLVSVYKPGGGFATSDDGVLLKNVLSDREYNITYSTYGIYRIVYTAKDASGKESSQPYAVEVVDMVAPVVTFNDGSTADTVQTVKLFYKYSVKDYTISDNASKIEDISVYTFIYDENGVIVAYDFKEFTITEEGVYTVYVYCIDESGNYGYAQYKLNAVV